MKASFFFCLTLTALALDFSSVSIQAGPVAAVATTTNTVAIVTNSVPKSVFNIPAAKQDGVDPFFPSSTRLWATPVSASTAPKQVKATGIDCLVLKGLSGAPVNPLAMINSRTMARGEDAEINTDCGRLLVHCVDITTNAAIIEVSGDRRELHLRSDF